MENIGARLFAQAQAPAQPTSPTSPTSDDRSTAFRSVEGGNQMQSGEKLLVEAYAAIWVILFMMLLLSWRRQKKMNERIAGLEQAVANVRAREKASPAAKEEAG